MDNPIAELLLRHRVRRATERRPVLPLPIQDLAAIRRVLLVLTTGIGDAVLSTPVFPAVRQALPEADIRLFCREAWTDLFAHDPNLNGVIAYPGKFRRVRSTLHELSAFAPELALVLHGNDPDILPLCYLAGSRYLLRIPTTGTRYDYLLSNLSRPEDAATLPATHYIDNRLRVLDTLGIPVAVRAPAIHLAPALLEGVADRLAARLAGRPYWVLHCHAADAYKSLPEELAGAVLDRVAAAHPEMCCLLTGGAKDRPVIDRLASMRPAVFAAAGEFNLAETAALLARARAVVAPDTGILHLGAALDRPVLGLYSPTRAALVGPRARTALIEIIEKPPTCDPCQQKKCPYRPVKCMAQFDADEVFAAISRILES